jgi:predicted nucleotidyltransferase
MESGRKVDARALKLSERHRVLVDRFVALCREDDRIVAAFVGGSYARGTADAYSDLDLGLITTDAAYADFFAERAAFIRRLGNPVFLDEFRDDGFRPTFFILDDGVHGELAFGREGAFRHIHGGPHVVLLDKTGLLKDVTFPEDRLSPPEQREQLRRLLYWFWHDLYQHFITALARDQLWTAVGTLEEMRRTCVDLARLAADAGKVPEGYEKVELVVPPERLAGLEWTFCPSDRGALLRATRAIVDYYRQIAPALAQAHRIDYPTALEGVVCARLDEVIFRIEPDERV